MVENGREWEPTGKLVDTRRLQLTENKGLILLHCDAEVRRTRTSKWRTRSTICLRTLDLFEMPIRRLEPKIGDVSSVGQLQIVVLKFGAILIASGSCESVPTNGTSV
jgi:hypothetical protein